MSATPTPLTNDEIIEELQRIARGGDQRSKLGALRMLHEINQMQADGQEATYARVQILSDGQATLPLPEDFETRGYRLAWVPVEADE
jgi:hypothetical protein